MQLTSIEQCRLSQIVYHPCHGEGYITFIDADGKTGTPCIRVKFPNTKGPLHHHEYFFENVSHVIGSLSYLYTEPVFICRRIDKTIYGFDKGRIETIYQPVNKEQ